MAIDPALNTSPIRQIRDEGSLKATAWLFGIIIGLALLLMLSRLADTKTELFPDRSELILEFGAWAGLGAGVLTAIAIVWFRPALRSSRLVSGMVLSCVMAVESAFAAGSLLEVVLERTDFRHARIVRSSAYLPIRRAYMSSGRGWHYHVQMVDPFPDLDINKRDYEASFGTTDDVRLKSWCLLATVERSGSAARIVNGKRWPFPAGKPVRCPA